MVSCSLSSKPSEFQKIWSILSDNWSYFVENMPTCMAYTPWQGYHFKRWKAKQALYDVSKCNIPCRDNNDKYYGIQHGLKRDFEPHIDKSAHILIWLYSHLMESCYILIFSRQDTFLYFDTGASKSMLNKKFYDEHPILHHYPKYPINVQPIQVASEQFMTIKEAIKFLISFGCHKFEIIAYLLPFSTSFDFIFWLEIMTDLEGKNNYSKLEFKFKKRSIGITPSKDINLPVGKTTAFDWEMVKKPSDLSHGFTVVKMKSQREDTQPQTLRVALLNGKIHVTVAL